MASGGRGNHHVDVLLPLLFGVSRESLPVTNGENPEGSRAEGCINGAISICGSPDLLGSLAVHGRNIAPAWIVVWRGSGPRYRGPGRNTSSVRGANADKRAGRI